MNFIHISGLEKNVNCSKNNNIIFSWNLNNSYFKDYKKKKFFHLSQIYQKNNFNIINTVSKLRKKLLSQIYKELNLLHKIDYSETEWEIILEPWLTNYLQSIYLRWIIVNEFTKIYKKFSYLKINVKKNIPFFDTLQYDTFLYNNDVYNHLLIQDILRYNNFKKNIITLNFNFELRNKFNQNNYTRIKNNFLFILYENIISKIFKIKMLINIRTKKINFFKLCFKLKILPFKGIAVFNRYKLIDILNKNSFKKKLRFNLKLKTNKKKISKIISLIELRKIFQEFSLKILKTYKIFIKISFRTQKL